MSALRPDRASLHQLLTDAVLGPDFVRAHFGGPVRGGVPAKWRRVAIRAVSLRDARQLQFSYFDGRKHIAANAAGADAAERLRDVLAIGFANIHATTRNDTLDVRITRRGEILIGRRPATDADAALPPHNRTKNLPLPEGRADRFLETLGVLTRDGRVRPAMRAKFTQINEFLRQLGQVLDHANLRSAGRELAIVDCGCGSSFLTLAAHHYLNHVLGVAARVLGVDVNDEVIRKSGERSQHVGANNVAFACQPIRTITTRPDIVLALHACDTATDDAIGLAVAGEARVLLGVPCCHHALNRDLHAAGPAAVLRPVLRHGILRERTADLVTDAFRAAALRIMGYRTTVVEFVGTEHTARNLMIRAVRGARPGHPRAVAEYRALRDFWGVTPHVERVLGEPLQQILGVGRSGHES
jgi:SAM-dependent methyltransferase